MPIGSLSLKKKKKEELGGGGVYIMVCFMPWNRVKTFQVIMCLDTKNVINVKVCTTVEVVY